MQLGAKLPEGNVTDKGIERLGCYLAKLLEIRPEDYADEKVTLRKVWLDAVAELMDPQSNPGAYRLCASNVVTEGACPLFLGLAHRASKDSVRSKAFEVLARVAFGCNKGPLAIVADQEFLPTLRAALHRGEIPEKLAALQLAQAVAASPQLEGTTIVPMVTEVAPMMMSQAFPTISKAALEVVISSSFHCPRSVADNMPGSALASLVAEDLTRPSWLPRDPLHILTCGLLVTNLLSEMPLECDADDHSMNLIKLHLAEGHFVEYLLFAMDAALKGCEWPEGTGAFHSPGKLTRCIKVLAEHGYSHRLVSTVEPLAQVIENNLDEQVTRIALQALRVLAEDICCLEVLLAFDAFRNDVLEDMHASGDEKDATELISYLATADQMLSAAQAAFTRAHSRNAPDICTLARIFTKFASFDHDLGLDQVLASLRMVPIGPSAATQVLINETKAHAFNFQSFAELVYGTRSVSGLWPTLMESTSVLYDEIGEVPRLLPLPELLSVFESCSDDTAILRGDVLLEKVLPALSLPTEGTVIEVAFQGITGSGALEFPAFVRWTSQLCRQLAEEEARQANEQAAQ